MDDQDENQHNMISNLPLLFANGYPTSLEKISERQLENFIPFMVQCSLGYINLQGKLDYSEPEWWPEDLLFIVPFTKPKRFAGNWLEKMKEIVIICYKFHKSDFLLRFCNDLASYEHASLRFINNYNSTTSLFDRRTGKLLVTFRNENMSYDQPQRNRKCLLQQKTKNDCQSVMVEQAPFDIYLCDHCDAELYSKEATLEHEKICQSVEDDEEDDDVILCDTPEPSENSQKNNSKTLTENKQLCIGFLLNFGLQNRELNVKNNEDTMKPNPNTIKEENFVVLDRNRRMPRRNRNVHTLSRCPTIPLTSPAGQLLLKTTKAEVSLDYLSERLDRTERFCHTPLISKSSNRPKYLDKKFTTTIPICTFKKPQEYSSHVYVFPRRQFSQKRRREDMLFLNSSLLKRCRPISVRLKKIKKGNSSTKLNMKFTRDASGNSKWKVSSCSSEVIVDTIDLCSSDEEIEQKNSRKAIGISSLVLKKNFIEKTQQSNFITQAIHNKTAPATTNSEISIIPLRRSLIETSDGTGNLEKSTIILNDFSSVGIKSNTPNVDSHLNQALINATVIREESGLPKPLRPSLYIFSNYTTVVGGNSNEIMTEENTTTVFRGNNNQENQQVQSNNNSSTVRKRATIAGSASTTTNWLPVTNNFIQNAQNDTNGVVVVTTGGVVGNNNSSSHQNNHLHERERTSSKSLSLNQKFNTPPRIISIDLTS